jgi:hypothetical protein
MRQSRLGVIHQQGFSPTHGRYAPYKAMMFQPRAIVVLLILGAIIQNPWWFVTLSAVLWWCALVPANNIFDAIYHVVSDRQGLARIGPAPAPRRFAQGMAATLAVIIAAALFSGAEKTAWVFEALLLGAALAVVFLRFCVGSYVYHLLTQRFHDRFAGTAGP